MDRSEEIVDNSDGWIATHIRECVETDGRRDTGSTAGTPATMSGGVDARSRSSSWKRIGS
jgi:hypothetical protein